MPEHTAKSLKLSARTLPDLLRIRGVYADGLRAWPNDEDAAVWELVNDEIQRRRQAR